MNKISVFIFLFLFFSLLGLSEDDSFFGKLKFEYDVAEVISFFPQNGTPEENVDFEVSVSKWSKAFMDEGNGKFVPESAIYEEEFDISQKAYLTNIAEGEEKDEAFYFISEPLVFELRANCNVNLECNIPGFLENNDSNSRIEVYCLQMIATHVDDVDIEYIDTVFWGGTDYNSVRISIHESEKSLIRMEFVLKYDKRIWEFETGVYTAEVEMTLGTY